MHTAITKTRSGRSRVWQLSVLAVMVATGCSANKQNAANEQPTADVLIVGGTLFDGKDAPGRSADIAITGDRIVAVAPGLSGTYQAHRTIDASGKIVAPGFIDGHTHPDTHIRSKDAATRRNLPWLHQGVSTIFVGVDGYGTPDIAADKAWFETNGVGTNVAAFVGLGPVRKRVLGDDARAPNPDELEQMRQLVAKGMCEGGFGLSSGLFYAPQSFTRTEDVVTLAREAALRGGIYDTHQRDESSYSVGLMGSVEEALEIGRRAELPVHFAHIKALGADVHGKAADVIARIERAHAEGQKVTADQYPWLASATGMGAALLPRWAVDGGREAFIARLDKADTAKRIREEMRANLVRRGGAEAILFIAKDWEWSGKTLAQMASQWKVDPIEAALRILREPSGTAARIASFNMSRADVDLFMKQPWVLTASDGGDGHPRQTASYSEKFSRFVVKDKVISLQDFIHRSSGLVATTLGVPERGFLQQGYYADVVVFDPQTYAPRASYTEPQLLTAGVDYLFVNGTAMIDEGRASQTLAGRFLLHTPTAGSCP